MKVTIRYIVNQLVHRYARKYIYTSKRIALQYIPCTDSLIKLRSRQSTDVSTIR